jgi:hypothetical protein
LRRPDTNLKTQAVESESDEFQSIAVDIMTEPSPPGIQGRQYRSLVDIQNDPSLGAPFAPGDSRGGPVDIFVISKGR